MFGFELARARLVDILAFLYRVWHRADKGGPLSRLEWEELMKVLQWPHVQTLWQFLRSAQNFGLATLSKQKRRMTLEHPVLGAIQWVARPCLGMDLVHVWLKGAKLFTFFADEEGVVERASIALFPSDLRGGAKCPSPREAELVGREVLSGGSEADYFCPECKSPTSGSCRCF